jgi:hypothetical protein
MILHFLSLTAAVSAQERGTDCNAVRKFVFPDADECNREQFCSDDFACDVTRDCDQYRCVSRWDCPDGMTYEAFSSTADDNGRKTIEVNSLNGYYCAPDPKLICGINSNGQFYIETTVKNKFPWDGIGTPDNRQLSMISKTKYDANDGGIFKQFGKSSCFGETINDGNSVRFLKSKDDPDCGDEIEISYGNSYPNGLSYVIDFYIGDDRFSKN